VSFWPAALALAWTAGLAEAGNERQTSDNSHHGSPA
jgi:hypothetical protein